MKFKMPSDVNKSSISQCMSITMNNRRKWIMENAVSIDEIFDKFPRLGDYSGEMVNNIMPCFYNLLVYWKRYFNFLRLFSLYFTFIMHNEWHPIVHVVNGSS